MEEIATALNLEQDAWVLFRRKKPLLSEGELLLFTP